MALFMTLDFPADELGRQSTSSFHRHTVRKRRCTRRTGIDSKQPHTIIYGVVVRGRNVRIDLGPEGLDRIRTILDDGPPIFGGLLGLALVVRRENGRMPWGLLKRDQHVWELGHVVFSERVHEERHLVRGTVRKKRGPTEWVRQEE